MAVFGAPVAHEDDPVRAVLAALAIRDALAADLEIRTAVNTGEALVALDADVAAGRGDRLGRRRQHRRAAADGGARERHPRRRGDVPRDAPRDRLPRGAGRRGEGEVAAGPRLGGRRRPLAVRHRRRADAPRRRSSAANASSSSSTDAFARSQQRGDGAARHARRRPRHRQEPPRRRALLRPRRRPGPVLVAAGPLAPVRREPQRLGARRDREGAGRDPRERRRADRAGEARRDSPSCRRTSALGRVAPPAARRRRRRASTSRGDRRAEAFSAWRRFFEALAEERPLVLVFEDLHWADDTLLDFVDHLAEWVVGRADAARRDRAARAARPPPGWGGGKRNATTLSIGALSRRGDGARSLLDRRCRPRRSALVLARAEGNPLYAAEYARMLDDQRRRRAAAAGDGAGADRRAHRRAAGRGEGARAGRLGPRQGVLAGARSIGVGATTRCTRSSGRSSSGATGAPPSPARRSTRSSTCSCATSRTGRSRARGGWRSTARAAEWIESLSPDRSEDRAEMLAHHYREALRLAEASGADTEPFRAPALRALADASERAAALSSWARRRARRRGARASRSGRPARPELAAAPRAREGLRPEPNSTSPSPSRHATASSPSGDLARRGRDRGAPLAGCAWWSGDGDERAPHAARALELAARPPDLRREGARLRAGRASRGHRRRAERARSSSRTRRSRWRRSSTATSSRSNALNSRGIARSEARRRQAALDDLGAGVELADRSNAPNEMSIARNNSRPVIAGFGRARRGDASCRGGCTAIGAAASAAAPRRSGRTMQTVDPPAVQRRARDALLETPTS